MEHKLKTFVAIGQNVWGKADNIYDAIKNAVSFGGTNRYVVYLVSDDFEVDGYDGSISATELHKLGFFNKGCMTLKGRD